LEADSTNGKSSLRNGGQTPPNRFKANGLFEIPYD